VTESTNTPYHKRFLQVNAPVKKLIEMPVSLAPLHHQNRTRPLAAAHFSGPRYNNFIMSKLAYSTVGKYYSCTSETVGKIIPKKPTFAVGTMRLQTKGPPEKSPGNFGVTTKPTVGRSHCGHRIHILFVKCSPFDLPERHHSMICRSVASSSGVRGVCDCGESSARSAPRCSSHHWVSSASALKSSNV